MSYATAAQNILPRRTNFFIHHQLCSLIPHTHKMADLPETFRPIARYLTQDYEYRDKMLQSNKKDTTLSKKYIFEVHRTKDTDFGAGNAKLESAERQIAADVSGLERASAWMATAYGDILARGAIQEFAEGVLFRHYMASGGALLSLPELSCRIYGAPGKVQQADYVMALLDFTGEIMRYGISHPADARVTTIVATIRCVTEHTQFLELALPDINKTIPGFAQKLKTIKASLNKMEKVFYEKELFERQKLNIDRKKMEEKNKRARLG